MSGREGLRLHECSTNIISVKEKEHVSVSCNTVAEEVGRGPPHADK